MSPFCAALSCPFKCSGMPSPTRSHLLLSVWMDFALISLTLFTFTDGNLYSRLALLDQELWGSHLLFIFRSPPLAPMLSLQ